MCATFLVRVGGIPWPKTVETYSQLGLKVNCRAIKEFAVTWELLNIIPREFGQKGGRCLIYNRLKCNWCSFVKIIYLVTNLIVH